jgi:hypothetical protein
MAWYLIKHRDNFTLRLRFTAIQTRSLLSFLAFWWRCLNWTVRTSRTYCSFNFKTNFICLLTSFPGICISKHFQIISKNVRLYSCCYRQCCHYLSSYWSMISDKHSIEFLPHELQTQSSEGAATTRLSMRHTSQHSPRMKVSLLSESVGLEQDLAGRMFEHWRIPQETQTLYLHGVESFLRS